LFAPPRVAWPSQQAAVEASLELERAPGKHLVIVRYSADHDFNVDWVHNPADIDAARVIWARDMGSRNQELIQYYRNRTVWLIEPDTDDPKLVPYPR
jgi:hypothetical protein